MFLVNRYPNIILLVLLLIQFLFWYGIGEGHLSGTRHIKPHFKIVPDVPSLTETKALSFGDSQMYFRILALQLQNAGESYGITTPINDYDYAKLSHWFYLLDKLDNKSSFVPSLVSYIYSNAKDKHNLKYLVDYLKDYSLRDLNTNWWWLGQAIYIARFQMQDQELALDLSYRLSQATTKIPTWASNMYMLLLVEAGKTEAAIKLIKNILRNIDDLDQEQINYMYYFIKDRLGVDELTKKQILELLM